MTNQPKRIWIDAKHGQHPDDWSFYVEGDITAKDHRKAGRLPYVPEVNSADAEAHLTALLRAEYERGVREAAAKMAEPAMLGLTLTKMEQSILALLTQKGK